MKLSASVLGKTTVDKLAAVASAPLLVIGTDVFYRRDLATIGCFNFTAAANLSALIAASGGKNTRDLYENVAPAALVLPGLGAISLAVLGAAFEAKGLGGDSPLAAWARKHLPKDADIVTFDTMKKHEAKREAVSEETRREARRRERRDMAHRQRVDRFARRQGVRV